MINELNKKQIICNPNYYAVYGLLIGDALGLPLEFSHREIVYRRKFKHLLIDNNIKDETIYRKSRDHEAGTISDDGSLALATIVALRKTFGENNNIKEQQYLKNEAIKLSKTENQIYQELMHNIMKEYYDWLATGKYAETAYQSLDCGETFREALIEYQKKVVIANKNNERNYLFQEKQDDFQQKSGNGTLMKQAAISCYFLNEYSNNINKIKISLDLLNNNQLFDELSSKYKTDLLFKELIDITTFVSSDINWITHNSIINDYLVKIFNLFIICLSILDSDIKERNDIKIKQKIIINILKFIDKFEFHDIDNIKFEFKNSEDKENAIKTINKIRHQLFDLITEKEFQLQKLETNIDVNTEKQKEIKNEQQKIYYILKNKIKSLFTKEQNNLCKPSLINNDNKEEYSITVNVSVTKDSKSEMQRLNENNEENEEHLLQPMFVFQENEYKSLPNSGYSFDSLLSALYCFYHSSDFQEAIVNAANLCGDADTIAAITGQLAGAYYQDDIQNKYYYYLLNGLKYKDKHEKIINDV